jgi:hypothetical protein
MDPSGMDFSFTSIIGSFSLYNHLSYDLHVINTANHLTRSNNFLGGSPLFESGSAMSATRWISDLKLTEGDSPLNL